MLEWRRRREPSTLMLALSPLIAIGLTMLLGMIVFTAMGYDGFHAVGSIFLTPFLEPQRWADIGVKGAPLILIALGLAVGFRANVWNIGAEGQYVMGAIAGTGVALLTYDMTGWWILPAMAIAGIAGGAAWAALPALLKVRLQVSEILTSLMLTYVAVQFLYYLVRGPWKDPDGFNFPQTRMFSDSQTLPAVAEGSLVHFGVPLAILLALIAWLVMSKTVAGYAVRVVGRAPAAARHGGFDANRVTCRTDRCGYSFYFEYDAEGRCVASHGQDGLLAVQLAYKPLEYETRVLDANGAEWVYQYTPGGAVTFITDPYGGTKHFRIGEDGRLLAEFDAKGGETLYVHDEAGAAVAKIRPDGRRIVLPEDEDAEPDKETAKRVDLVKRTDKRLREQREKDFTERDREFERRVAAVEEKWGPRVKAAEEFERYLRLIVSIGLEMRLGDADLLGDLDDALHLRLLGDLDIG